MPFGALGIRISGWSSRQACVQLGKWDVALKLLGTMERDGTQLAAWWRLKLWWAWIFMDFLPFTSTCVCVLWNPLKGHPLKVTGWILGSQSAAKSWSFYQFLSGSHCLPYSSGCMRRGETVGRGVSDGISQLSKRGKIFMLPAVMW
jgi:hypothetical protein